MLNELDLHLTNRCTTECKYCCFSSNRLRLLELNTDEVRNLIDSAFDLGCQHIHFTGGEPLLREDLFEIVSYVNKKGMKMRLQTNGMLLSNTVANKLMNSGLKSIMISLDSSEKAIHDRLRGKGTWELAVEAIKTALKAGFRVRVNSVLTTYNIDGVLDTIAFVRTLGVEDYSAFYFSPIGCGRDCKDIWLDPKQYYSKWMSLQSKLHFMDIADKMNIVIEKAYANWEEALRIDVSGFTGCGGGCASTYKNRDYLIVRCDGNVYPCIMSIDSEPLGNIRERPLSDIYSNSKVWDNLLPQQSEECEECVHYNLCGGGCYYYPGIKTNNHDGRCELETLVPLCPIMKYNSRNGMIGGSSEDVMV